MTNQPTELPIMANHKSEKKRDARGEGMSSKASNPTDHTQDTTMRKRIGNVFGLSPVKFRGSYR